MMKWKYGNAWEQFPIENGEVWGLKNGSRVAVHDIFNSLPKFMYTADLIFSDPPWNQGNLTSFYTKAHKKDYQKFEDFTNVFFQRLAEISPYTCYIEIGNQKVYEWIKKLKPLYKSIQHWPVLYYKKNPTNILRGSTKPTTFNFTDTDETKVIEHVAKYEQYDVLGDLCMGRGLVGISAFDNGKPFVGTELNKRRLANLMQQTHKKGAQWYRVCI